VKKQVKKRQQAKPIDRGKAYVESESEGDASKMSGKLSSEYDATAGDSRKSAYHEAGTNSEFNLNSQETKTNQHHHQTIKLATGRKSNLVIENKLLIYKTIIIPIWTYGL
jgi:hypothetical protein